NNSKDLHEKRQRDEEATSESNPIQLAAFFRSKIEQHDNEQEQHHHGASVDKHLNDSDKECVERHKQGGKPKETNYQTERTRDRVTVNDNGCAEDKHHNSEEPEEKRGHQIKWSDGVMEYWVKGKRACDSQYSITPVFGYFFSFHFKTTPCITPPISSSLSLLCTISARVSPVMA